MRDETNGAFGRCRRHFLIIGAMKAGTTSLYTFLTSHPDVGGPATKELHYFSLRRARLGLPGYEFLLRRARGSIVGEASPTYAEDPRFGDVARRVRLLLPNVRLIYLVRDPIQRMESHFHHELIQGREHPGGLWRDEYVNPSLYGHQLGMYLRYFEPSAIAVVDSGFLRAERQSALRRLFAFLGVSEEWAANVDGEDVYVSADRAPISPLFAPLKRSPTMRAIARKLPASMRAAARTAASSATPGLATRETPTGRAEVPPVPSRIHLALRQDRQTFLEHVKDCHLVSDREPETWWEAPSPDGDGPA